MAERCGCPNEADEIVFGAVHECSVDPSLAVQRPVPWWKPRPYEHVLDDSEPGDLG
jgi:hypothetical protein